jgi:TolB-like protein/DNA-binding winged helix-turn-helix (wHTH) protein/Flp pilus assembly protein TadD
LRFLLEFHYYIVSSQAQPSFRGTLRFGAYEADPRSGELRKHGLGIALEEKPFQALVLLLQHPNEVVTREELRTQLWPADIFIDFDNSLNTVIAKVRRALNDSAENPRFIETVGRGYRFIAPVESSAPDPDEHKRDSLAASAAQGSASVIFLDSPEAAASERADQKGPASEETAKTQTQRSRYTFIVAGGALVAIAVLLVGLNVGGLRDRFFLGSSPGPIKSLAVLPLENLSGDKEQEYFADGMTDELITDLAQIGALRVISRTSIIQYKGTKKSLPEIGRELNVDVVVEGTVTRAGNRVRITAQLIRATTDKHLWAEEYEGDLSDILKLQNEVARAITTEIQIKLTPQEDNRLASARPVNPESHEAYLKGRYYLEKWSTDGTKQAIGYFQQAVEKDPTSALAYAGLAECYMHWSPLPPKESHAKAKAAAMKAMELDETLGEAHASLGLIRLLDDWDLPGAEQEFKRAIELDPSSGEAHHEYSHYLMQMDRPEESHTESNRFLELDPLSPAPNLHLGWYYLFTKQYDAAIEQLQKTLKMDPNYVEAHSWLGQAYEQKQMYGEAVAELQKAVALSGRDPYYLALLGHAYALSGKKDQAQAIIAELKSKSSPASPTDIGLAIIYTGLGDRDNAFAWLEKAYQRRSGYLANFFRVNPMFDSLHSDARFTNLVRRIGFFW